jgi:hypothetical protein
MIASSEKPPSVRWVFVNGLFAVAAWVLVALTGSDIAYYFAIAFTVRLLLDGIQRWARSTGLPEWTANEAYITRLRRWRRSKRAGAGR